MTMRSRAWTGLKRNNMRLGGALALVVAATVATPAVAELPSALDRVPADAVVAIATPSLDRLDKNAQMLITAIGMPQLSTPSQLMGAIGLRAGVDMSRSAAIMMLPGNMEADAPPAVLLLPVSDYAAMLGAFGVTSAAGVATFNAAGEEMFAKDVGDGYAAISPLRAALDAYTGKAGNLAAHAIKVGAAGSQVASESDVALIIDSAAMSAMVGPDVGAMMGMMMGPVAGMGADPRALGGGLTKLMQETTAIVMGLRAGSMGLHIDMAAQFKPGSPRHEAFSSVGQSRGLLKNLPGDPYILAFAMDVHDPRFKTMLMGGEGKPPTMAGPALFAMLDHTKAQSGAIYPNPAGLLGGLLARGVYYYETDNAEKFAGLFKTTLHDLDGVIEGDAQIQTAFTDAAAEVNGVKLDSYTLKMRPAPGKLGTSPLAMFYGPTAGPNGFVARTKSGVYMTTTPDSALMGKALKASEGGSLADDRALSQVADMLPRNRIGEMYLSVKTIMDQVTPFLAMMGQQINVQAPADLPPIGVALTSEGGGMRLTAYAPAPTIKTLGAVAQSAQGLFGAPRGNGQQGRPGF